MSYIYLASPYSDPDPLVMQARYELVRAHAAEMMWNGEHVYSPIVHSHPMAVAHDLPRDHAFWKEYNMAMLATASALVVLMLDGWDRSTGVEWEIIEAGQLGLTRTYVPPRCWMRYSSAGT